MGSADLVSMPLGKFNFFEAEGTRVQPLTGLFSVRQKGGLPGPHPCRARGAPAPTGAACARGVGRLLVSFPVPRLVRACADAQARSCSLCSGGHRAGI